MDTTRRQLLAAIPAVGVASVVGQGQEWPVQKQTWAYTTLGFSTWILDSQDDTHILKLLTPYGVQGYSVGSIQPAGAFTRTVLKRSIENRLVWEFKSFPVKADPFSRHSDLLDYNATGAEGWEIFYVTPNDAIPGMIHAQRVING